MQVVLGRILCHFIERWIINCVLDLLTKLGLSSFKISQSTQENCNGESMDISYFCEH
jgi:hypothetical protein